MARPKKEIPNHGPYFEIKATVDQDLQGKPIRKSFYSLDSREDARKQSELYIQSLKESQQLSGTFLTSNKNFSSWCDVFLLQYIKGNVKDNTYWNNYSAPIENHLKPYFGKVDLTDIKPIDIKLFFKAKQEEGLALGTLEKLRVCLHSIFDTAVENDLCSKNPVTKRIKVDSNKPVPVKRTYNREQCDAIIAFARTHKDGLGIILMLENGLSRSELLGLTWDMINFDDESLTVSQGLVALKDVDTSKRRIVEGAPKNEYRKRTTPLKLDTVAMLRERYRNRSLVVGGNKSKKRLGAIVLPRLIFCDTKGQAIDPDNWSKRTYANFMKDMIVALGETHKGIEKLTAHELRHTFATLAQQETDDLLALMRAMGHADFKMLQRTYAHVSLEQMRKALGRSKESS